MKIKYFNTVYFGSKVVMSPVLKVCPFLKWRSSGFIHPDMGYVLFAFEDVHLNISLVSSLRNKRRHGRNMKTIKTNTF